MESLQIPCLWAMLSCYVGALVVHIYGFLQDSGKAKRIGFAITLLGVMINIWLIILRGVLIHGIPLNNGYEFGLSFAFVVAAIFLIVEWKFDLAGIGIFALPIAIALTGWLLNLDMTVKAINPALRSYWLSFHVSAAVIAYGTFAMSFALSIAYLIKDGGRMEKLPSAETLDEVSYKMICVGLPFLTIMLVTGAVWAEYAWGAYWSWDPKETFALVTWIVYALYLHIRLMRGWRGKRTALLSILGFCAIIFTFFGVSYLLPGLHSYIG